MRELAVLLSLIIAICIVPAQGKTLVELTETDWLSAAKAALKLTSRSDEVTFVVNDDLPLEAQHALQTLRKVVALIDVPEPNIERQVSGNYMRVFQFRLQGDRIEFLEGSAYPIVYQPGDCRLKTHIFLARAGDGEWKQDGPAEIKMCSRH